MKLTLSYRIFNNFKLISSSVYFHDKLLIISVKMVTLVKINKISLVFEMEITQAVMFISYLRVLVCYMYCTLHITNTVHVYKINTNENFKM